MSLVPILNYINPVYIVPIYFFEIRLNTLSTLWSFKRRLLVRYFDDRNSLFSFNITLDLLHLHFLLRLCILTINLYNIIGSLILGAEIARRLKLLSLGSVITLIGVVKGEKHAVGCDCVRADVPVGDSS